MEQRSSYEALPVVVHGKCPEEMLETNSNAMGVVNSKLAQCPSLEKQHKNPRTVVNFRAYIVSKSVGQEIYVYSRLSPFPSLRGPRTKAREGGS